MIRSKQKKIPTGAGIIEQIMLLSVELCIQSYQSLISFSNHEKLLDQLKTKAVFKYMNDLLPFSLDFTHFIYLYSRLFNIHVHIYLPIMILQIHLFKS